LGYCRASTYPILLPFVREEQKGIDVMISFDGNNFEIKEYPAAHSNTVIFRGTIQ
jgi:hypothetical protein